MTYTFNDWHYFYRDTALRLHLDKDDNTSNWAKRSPFRQLPQSTRLYYDDCNNWQRSIPLPKSFETFSMTDNHCLQTPRIYGDRCIKNRGSNITFVHLAAQNNNAGISQEQTKFIYFLPNQYHYAGNYTQ